MIYNYRSANDIIAKVYRDLQLSEENIPINDFMEWIGEALEKIGAYTSFTIKVTGLEDTQHLIVSNYQAQLPKDLFRLISVSYGQSETGDFYPLRYGTGVFDHRVPNTTTTSSTELTAAENDIVLLTMQLYDLTYEAALALINTDEDVRAKMNTLLVSCDTTSVGSTAAPSATLDLTYTINNSYIKLNQATGYLRMAYLAMPTDQEGFPLVPDDPAFSEALYWYILMKMMYPKHLLGQIRDRQYYDIRHSWNFYCKQAYAHSRMPNIDQHESIANATNKLMPELSEHANAFNTLGERQILYNH